MDELVSNSDQQNFLPVCSLACVNASVFFTKSYYVKYILSIDCSMENAINIIKQNKKHIYFLLSIFSYVLQFVLNCGLVSKYELEKRFIPGWL